MSRRLLILVTDLEIGGTPTVVRELAIRLHARGHRVAVACLGRRGPVADQIASAGVDVTALSAVGQWDLRILPRLITLLRTGQTNRGMAIQPVVPALRHTKPSPQPSPDGRGSRNAAEYRGTRAGSPCHDSSAATRFDTVLSFLIHANALASVACSLTRTRLFQSIQTTQPWPRWHWAVQRFIAPLAERIVVPSQSVADVARDWSGIAPSQIQIIPNAIDPADFNITPLPVSTPAHIGFIGRLDPIKRVGDLIEAIAILTDEARLQNWGRRPRRPLGSDPGRPTGASAPLFRDVVLHIFGDGPERPRLERQIGDLGLQRHVTLHGAVPRPQDALEQISVLVLPSAAEGFGLVLIEAMAAGVPVIATDAPGIRDVVRHDHTGILVPICSPASLAFAIQRLLDDGQLRQRLTAAARCEVARRFSWSSILPVYEELLSPEP
ncbi:MAG: glycosyltransferase family 4 protein [Tepidisphaerales bacterium]